MAFTDIKTSQPGDGSFWITIARPSRKNATRAQTFRELTAAIDEAERAPGVAVVVFTGEGDYFTSGADIKDTMQQVQKSGGEWLKENPSHDFMKRMNRMTKITVAAVNGPAVGIGVTLVLQCDFAYCSTEATFWTPFKRIGLVPEFGATRTFQERLGRHAANELLLLERRVDAVTAKQWGLIGDVFPRDAFAARVAENVKVLLAGDPALNRRSLLLFKQMQRPAAAVDGMERVIDEEWNVIKARFQSGDTFQAMAALMQEEAARKAKL